MASPFPFTSGQVLTAAQLNSIGEWTSWTPTWTNLTVGNGTVTAEYAEVNEIVFYRVKLVFGSTTAVTGDVRIAFPIAADDAYLGGLGGTVHFEDASPVASYIGVLNRAGTANCFVSVINASSTYATYTNMNATTPITWTTGDILVIEDFYKPA